MKTLIVFLLTIPLLACTPKEAEKPLNFNGYSAIKVRSLWQLCYQAHMQNVKPPNPVFFSLQCDCVVDRTMKDHHADEINKAINLQSYFTETNITCSKEVKEKYFGHHRGPQINAGDVL